MTLHPRRVDTRLTAAATLLEHIRNRLPRAIGLTQHHIPDRPRGEDAIGIRRPGWISDPTGETATTRAQRETHELDDLQQQLDTLTLTLGLIAQFVERHDPAAVEHYPPCGDQAPSEIRQSDWYTTPNRHGRVPYDCTAEAETYIRNDGTRGIHRLGLCPTHRRAFQQWERDHEQMQRTA